MVSIHRVPVDVLLIISVVCFIFRFNRGVNNKRKNFEICAHCAAVCDFHLVCDMCNLHKEAALLYDEL